MAKLRLTVAALDDLDEIREHGSGEFGPVVSARYLEGFDRKFALLRAQPRAGQARPEFRRDIRSLPYRPYRILYEIDGDTVVIARIIHQSRDVLRALYGLQ